MNEGLEYLANFAIYIYICNVKYEFAILRTVQADLKANIKKLDLFDLI